MRMTDYNKLAEFYEIVGNTSEEVKTIYENGLFKAYWLGYERGKKEQLNTIIFREIKDEE
jgi:hypothetical protein